MQEQPFNVQNFYEKSVTKRFWKTRVAMLAVMIFSICNLRFVVVSVFHVY